MVSSKVIFAIFATIGLLALFMYVTPGSKRALLGSVNYDSSHEETWRQFQVFTKDFNKTYRSLEEMNDRFNIFHDNFYWIQVENQRSLSVKYAINHFTDLTQEEFRNNYLGYKEDPSQEIIYEEEEDIQVQGSIDWVQKGAVTHVKNQGQCGSCWAFSAVGSLEGAYFLKKGSLVSFSEQELVDCSVSYGNNGCNGGSMNSAFKYWQDHGEEKESDYPYKANEGNCKQTKSKAVTKVSKHVGVKPNEASLKKALNLVQFQWQQMLQDGHIIAVVFMTMIAQLILIMVQLQQDMDLMMEKTTGEQKIHGALHGVRKDSLD